MRQRYDIELTHFVYKPPYNTTYTCLVRIHDCLTGKVYERQGWARNNSRKQHTIWIHFLGERTNLGMLRTKAF